MNLNRSLYVIIIFLVSSHAVRSLALSVKVLSEIELSSLIVIDAQMFHTGTDACIRKVTDGTTVFILKQIVCPSISEQFLLINDCVASTIGFQANIPINEVFLIPYFVGSHLKIYPERAATLHTFVPGQDLELKLPTFLSTDFSVHQRVINVNSAWQKQFPLAINKQGFSRLCIESMSFHENLPLIIALDTFIGNGDRSKPNIFYDEQCNCFYGIDQAAAFSKQLPLLASERLQELIYEKYFESCDVKIIDSLCLYRDMLRLLYNSCKPRIIIELMQKLSFFVSADALCNAEIEARLRRHRDIIENNYVCSTELITLLDQILL